MTSCASVCIEPHAGDSRRRRSLHAFCRLVFRFMHPRRYILRLWTVLEMTGVLLVALMNALLAVRPVPVFSFHVVHIPTLFESPRLLVVNKPHDVCHHNEGQHQVREEGEDDEEIKESDDENDSSTAGILTLLREQRRQQQQQQIPNENERLWGVHRLDKVTSGILVFAKDAEMASLMSNAFKEGRIQKIYIGVSSKPPRKKSQGLVQGGMERSRNKAWKLVPPKTNPSSRHKNFAKTRFFTTKLLLNNLESSEEQHATTAIMFRPYTGRTHQLRVAAKAMGMPLLGDPIYASSPSRNDDSVHSTFMAPGRSASPNGRPRTMLHASGIHIPSLAVDQAEVNIWCPPPFFESVNQTYNEYFQAGVEKLMKKHCDVPGILTAMQATRQSKSIS